MSCSYILRFVTFANVAPIALVIGGSMLAAAADGVIATLAWILVSVATAIAYMAATPLHVALRAGPTWHDDDWSVVVGGGWSSYLKKRGVGRRAVFDRVYGRTKQDWWRSGTTIAQVQAHLRARGRTLASHPSVKTSTLGGWIFSNSHGSGGTLWTPQFKVVRAYDQLLRKDVVAPPKTLFHASKTMEEQRRFIIREVEIASVEDVWCKKTAFRLRDARDAQNFLEVPSYLRLMQVGRRGTLCLIWVPCDAASTTAHRDPHLLSRLSLWFQADVLSALQSSSRREDWFDWPVEPASNWTSIVRLSDANDFSPAPIPFFASLTLAYRNFELFVRIVPTPAMLVALCHGLESVVRGRCEVRCGKDLLFLDFACPMSASLSPLFAFLKTVLGDAPVSLHKGKADVDLSELQVARSASSVV